MTEQHEAEVARDEAQELFETAFSHAPIGMALIGLDGRWLKVNRAVCAITGWPEAELLRRTFQDITHPDDLEADLRPGGALLAGEISGYRIEKRYLTRGGGRSGRCCRSRWCATARARPRHFISQIEDISQRKRAEERLREAEAEARASATTPRRSSARCTRDTRSPSTARSRRSTMRCADHRVLPRGADRSAAAVPVLAAGGARGDLPAGRCADVMRNDGGRLEVTFMRANGERFEAEVTARPAREADGRRRSGSSPRCATSRPEAQPARAGAAGAHRQPHRLANRHVLQESLAREAARRSRRSTSSWRWCCWTSTCSSRSTTGTAIQRATPS